MESSGVGYPQHPEKKQRSSLKKPPRCWGVCGRGCEVAVSDDDIVSGTVEAEEAEEAEAEEAEAEEKAEAEAEADVFSSSTAAISSSICSVVTSLSIASV